MSSDDYNPAAIGGQSSLLSPSTESRFLMQSPAASSPECESRNEMLLADETAGKFSADEVVIAIIFSFLPPVDILRLRRVCTTWRDAAKKTLVPLTDFWVDSVTRYNAMRVMSTAVPNLQQLSICKLEEGHKYNDGKDPDESRAFFTYNLTSHDIDMIPNFSKLRILEIEGAPLNGRYPLLFNFPLLKKLSIRSCFLQWNLDMLEGLPMLKELYCYFSHNLKGNLKSLRVLRETLEVVEINGCANVGGNLMDLADFPRLTELSLSCINKLSGSINSLGALKNTIETVTIVRCPDFEGNVRDRRVLKDTLEKVTITDCSNIRGNFMDLADFPRLRKLNLRETAVTGDIRDIREHDFPALEHLILPNTALGGIGYEIQNVADVPSLIHAIHLLLQRSQTMFEEYWFKNKYILAFNWKLSRDSPEWYDWYDRGDRRRPRPPFDLQIIQAGSRLGWSWCTFNYDDEDKWQSCEINWLDPEPNSESGDYEAYIEELRRIERRINFYFYRGYHQPPTEEEYRRLGEGLPLLDST